MQRALIMLAAATLLWGCATPPTVERTAPRATEFVAQPAIDVQTADGERIRAEREKALRSTPASMAEECREAFKALHVRGIVDGLTVYLARVHISNLNKLSEGGVEKRELAKAQLLGFCYTARSLAASNSHKPIVSAGSITSSGPAASRLDDMYRRTDCVPRNKDLKDLGVLTDEAMTELFLYIQDRDQPTVRRIGLLNGHCTAVNVVWTGLIL